MTPSFQGFVDARSRRHVAGWVHDQAAPGARVAVEAVLDGQVIASDRADRRSPALIEIKIGDGAHAFDFALPPGLSDAERERVLLRPAGGEPLPLSPWLRTEWQPIRFVAMDVVDNCNLRCPFCVFDYAGVNRTNFMTPAVMESALRLMPYTTQTNFWLSCLHEPTLHPGLLDLMERIPDGFARQTFFTTNLAKRMSDGFFAGLARARLHHLNISIESLEPAIYERMRKGARHPIFLANWAALLSAFRDAPDPPRLRYIVLAYRSNLAELPGLVAHLLAERLAWQVEVRFTYPQPHIPAEFSAAEFLPDAAWDWLGAELAAYPADRVLLIKPPPAPEPGRAAAALPGRPPAGMLEIFMKQDGSMLVSSKLEASQDHDITAPLPVAARRFITDVPDVEAFIKELL